MLTLDIWKACLYYPLPPTAGVFKAQLNPRPQEESRLVPSNNRSLGAGKRGPGTNVAIMVMVKITGDGHYWHSSRLLWSMRPAAAGSHHESPPKKRQGKLVWQAAGGRRGSICPLLIIIPPSFTAAVLNRCFWPGSLCRKSKLAAGGLRSLASTLSFRQSRSEIHLMDYRYHSVLIGK